MGEQPLLIALVAVQFFVHALGWAMATQLTRRWHSAEAQFAVHWLLLSAGLMLYVPPWRSGSMPRNLGDLLIVAAMVMQYRGMSLYWGRPVRWRGAVALLAATALVVAYSLDQPNGHGLRVSAVCFGVGLALLATAWIIWRMGRATTPLFAPVLAGCYSVMALALLLRAVQALMVAPGTKISIDAPGHSNLPLAILVMFIGGLLNLAQIRLALGSVLHHLRTQALTDALTGAVNRRGLVQELAIVHQRAHQQTQGYAVLMVDVDHFKTINDRFGHDEGDRVLKRVASSLSEGVRHGDVVARWGGEEFCVLLPNMQLAEARTLAERLLARIAASGNPPVTVSIGLALVALQLEDGESVIRRADAALYRAKQAGRNRVELAEPVEKT